MPLTIKDIKSMNEGTQIKGLPLMIKTARNTFNDPCGQVYQEVVFMDATGEMTGHILLELTDSDTHGQSKASNYIKWNSKTNICIMSAEVQCTDERKKEANKLVVYECFDAATPLSYDQQQDLQAEDWKKIREDEIRGKVRHWVTIAMIESRQIEPDITSGKEHIPKFAKNIINEITDFIITGE